MGSELVKPHHLDRRAVVYVRQSTPHQVLSNQESLRLQYALRQRARDPAETRSVCGWAGGLGWREADVEVVDADLGLSAASAAHRQGFKDLVARIALGEVGLIVSIEVTRLARNCSDWYPLLDICGHRGCLIADRDTVYDHRPPADPPAGCPQRGQGPGQDRAAAGLHGRRDERLADRELARSTAAGQNIRDALRRPGPSRLNSPTVFYIRADAGAIRLDGCKREGAYEGADLAIARTAPCLLALLSLVTLWTSDLAARGLVLPRRAARCAKPVVTFSGALAAVRRQLWTAQAFSTSLRARLGHRDKPARTPQQSHRSRVLPSLKRPRSSLTQGYPVASSLEEWKESFAPP